MLYLDPAPIANPSVAATTTTVTVTFDRPIGIFDTLVGGISTSSGSFIQNKTKNVGAPNPDGSYTLFFDHLSLLPGEFYSIRLVTMSGSEESIPVFVNATLGKCAPELFNITVLNEFITDMPPEVNGANVAVTQNNIRLRPAPVDQNIDYYNVDMSTIVEPDTVLRNITISPDMQPPQHIFRNLEYGQNYVFNISTVIRGVEGPRVPVTGQIGMIPACLQMEMHSDGKNVLFRSSNGHCWKHVHHPDYNLT